jgi:hypothetical protein
MTSPPNPLSKRRGGGRGPKKLNNKYKNDQYEKYNKEKEDRKMGKILNSQFSILNYCGSFALFPEIGRAHV